jgi:hypothetical protein
VARGRSEEEPAPERASPVRIKLRDPEPLEEEHAPLKLPAPEKLGLADNGRAAVNWTEVHNRLDRLGALSFYQQKVAANRFRVTFLFPSSQPNRAHQVEAEAQTAEAAVALALERAEQWAGTK